MAKDQIEDQVRYIKRHGPEMPGISFWGGSDNWSDALGGLNGFLDRMCLKYYIMPVVSVRPQCIWLSDYDPRAGQEIGVRVRVHNMGGMEAKNVKVQVFARDLNTQKRSLVSSVTLPEIGVDKVEIKRDPPWKPTKEKRYPPVTWKDVQGKRVPLEGNTSTIRLDRRIVEVKWTPRTAGHYRLEVEVDPSSQYTLLDGYAEKWIAIRP